MVVGLAVLLSACGFQLRGTGENLALNELDVKARNAFGQTLTDVRERLQDNGVTVSASAPYTLVLSSEEENLRAASYSNAGRSAEHQINIDLYYQLLNEQKHVLLSDKVSAQRFYMQDQNNVIGSSEEARQIKIEMRRELIDNLIGQLRLISPERLSSLEQQAQARADAEKAAAGPQHSPVE